MRRKISLIILAAMLILLLAACGENENTEIQLEPGVIHYPGLAWNLTQEEVIEALNIDEKDIKPNGVEASPQQQVFCVEDWEFLGQKGTILFEFWNETSDYFGLRRVVIFYPEGTDLDALEKEMTALLGEGIPISDGEWLRWDSEKQYSDFMELGLAEMKEQYPEAYENKLKLSEGVCASFVTLRYDAGGGWYPNMSPYEGWDGEGSTISFFANYMPLLQYAEFGMDLP